MRIGIALRLQFFVGLLIGSVITLAIAASAALVHERMEGKLRETILREYYVSCMEFFTANAKAPASADDLMKFANEQHKPYEGFWKPLLNGNICYYKISPDQWVLFSLDSGVGEVLAERTKHGGLFRCKWTRLRPKPESFESDEDTGK